MKEKIEEEEFNDKNSQPVDYGQESPNDFDFNSYIEENYGDKESIESESMSSEESKEILKKITKYKIKDYLMMIFLLLSSSLNFSILYIPLILFGIYYIFLLRKFNNHNISIKRKIEKISFIYSFLLFLFKSTILVLIQNKHINYDNYSCLFHNLGIKIDDNEKNVGEILISLIGETFLVIISFISIIITHAYRDINFDRNNDDDNNNNSLNESFNVKIKTLIYLAYITILVNAIYNKSFLTIIYLISYQSLLTIIVLKIKSFKLFRKTTIVYLIFLVIQLLLINIFNIYTLQKKFLEVNIIQKDKIKLKKFILFLP